MAHPCRVARLGNRTGARLAVQLFGHAVEHVLFERDGPVQHLVVRQPDSRHAAAAQQ